MSSLRRLRYGAVIAGATLTACGGSDGPSEPASPPLSALELFPARRVAVVGDNFTYDVTARDLSGATVTVTPRLTSSNAAVVTVDPRGVVTARGAGTATIHATAGGRTADLLVHVGAATYDFASLGAPRILDANYIDLAKIERFSRFRSAIGHSYTDGSETCRSMKHYFQPKTTLDWTTVDEYVPAEGMVLSVTPDGAFGKQVAIRPLALPLMYIMIFHVTPDPGIVPGAWVTAGQHLGKHSTDRTMSDIAISIGPKEGGRLISFFDAMTDAVFQQYAAHGVMSRSAAIITKEQRDADPVPCVGEQGFTSSGTIPNWVVIN